MSDLILHHYGQSPFAAKIRAIFGYKELAWRSVQQPPVMPKPDLLPLTGGYRKIPVLQVGADVYCDTALIASVIDRMFPEPSIYAAGTRGMIEMIAHWADHWLFGNTAVPTLSGVLDKLPAAFVEDRAAMGTRLEPGMDLSHFRSQLLAALNWLEDALSQQPFVAGEQFSLADASCLVSVGFMRRDPELFSAVAARPAIENWLRRVREFGEGDRSDLAAEEALDIAAASVPETVELDDGTDPNGFRPGDRVSINADDYGREKVEGELVVVSREEFAVRRQDDRVGEVIVHFPRAGFRLKRI